jgi:hypothetical protein
MDLSLILHTGFHFHPHGVEILAAGAAVLTLGGLGYLLVRRGR